MRRLRGLGVCLAAGLLACGDNGGSGDPGETAGDSSSDGSTAGESSESESESESTDADSSTDSTDSTGDADDTTDTGETGGDEDCGPIGEPPPEGPIVQVGPSDADSLPQLVADAEPNTTFLFADGTYDLSAASILHVTTPGLRFVGGSHDRDAVILDADYAVGEIFLVAASNTTLAHMTIQRATWHPIHVTGGTDANVENTLIYDVAVVDPGQQAIKINPSGAGYYADFGTVACSEVILTDAGRPNVSNCYTGGIDAHGAWGWTVRDNYFEGWWCEQGLSEHAVHFWTTSRDTLVERNTIVDCARGIGFGLGENGNGNQRAYDDDPCPGADFLGHVDGEIRNNSIWAGRAELFASQSGFDSGVALEQACGARVVHNTVVSLQPPFVSMEYRWPNTSAEIVNNLVSHDIVERNGGQASLSANLEGQGLEHFVDGAGGDLHLVGSSTAIDAGDPDALGWTDEDIDRDPRDSAPDVGSDEHAP